MCVYVCVRKMLYLRFSSFRQERFTLGMLVDMCLMNESILIATESLSLSPLPPPPPSPQVQKASLVDSRTSVNDVKFAPQHLGLMLVS